ILKDAEKARNWLEKFDLNVDYIPRKGFQVQGGEASWREAMVQLLITKLGILKLLSLGNDPDSKLAGNASSDLNTLNKMLVQTLKQIEFPTAFHFIKRVENA